MDLKNGIIEINGITINKDTDNNKNLIDTTKEYKVAFFDDEYNVRIDFSDYTNKIWSIKYVLADNNKDFAFLEKKQEELTKKIENALGIVSKKCGKHLDAFDLDWGYISVQVAKQISPKPPICFIEISYFKPREKEKLEVEQKFKNAGLYKSGRNFKAYCDAEMRYTAYSGTGSPEEILDIYFLINEEIFNELIDGDTTNQSRNLLLKRGNIIYRLSYSKWGRKYKIRKI